MRLAVRSKNVHADVIARLVCLFVALACEEVETMAVTRKKNRKSRAAQSSFPIHFNCKLLLPVLHENEIGHGKIIAHFHCVGGQRYDTLAQSKRRTHKMNAIYLRDGSFRFGQQLL